MHGGVEPDDRIEHHFRGLHHAGRRDEFAVGANSPGDLAAFPAVGFAPRIGHEDVFSRHEHVQGVQDIVQGFQCAQATGHRCTIGDDAGGFERPFLGEVIDGVFQPTGVSAVVFGADEDEGVKACDRLAPGPGLGVLVVAVARQVGLVEEGQVEVANADDLDVKRTSPPCAFGNPIGDRGAGGQW